MKKRYLLTLIFLGMAVSAFAQSRDDVHIYIRSVITNHTQSAYFRTNFAMETMAAGYAVVENVNDADYVLHLDVKNNTVLYNELDGSVSERQAPKDEPQFLLLMRLIRQRDNVEIVALSFPFTELEEMNDYNLFLLYQIMANVPLVKLTDEPKEKEIEYVYIHDDPAEKDKKDKRAAIGIGYEWNMSARDLFAGGAVLSFDINFAHSLALGATLVASFNIGNSTVFEPSGFFRWYFSHRGHRSFFVQADAGGYYIIENNDTFFMVLGGLKTGYRFPYGPLYIEPYGRVGYPFVFGIGVVAGVEF